MVKRIFITCMVTIFIGSLCYHIQAEAAAKASPDEKAFVKHCAVCHANLLAFGKKYGEAGLPSLTAVFTGAQLDRLTFQWILATAVSLQLVGLFGLMQSSLVQISLSAVSLWLSVQGIKFMREREPDYISVFKRANYFMLIVMLIIFIDKLPRFVF
jgi:heme O synthase-like polyprenyltransferase